MDYKEAIIEMLKGIKNEESIMKIYGFVAVKYISEASDKNESEEQN